MHTREEKLEAVGRLLDIMDKLRAECPWNGAQTQDSLRQLTLEEVFELSDAVLSHKDSDIEKELGDLLLHIVFYAKIAEENGLYDIADIASRECEKMVFRHPHVFSGEKEADAQSVSEHWELRKLKERAGKHILDGRTGLVVSNGVASASVIAPSAMLADALSTALFVMGPDEGGEFLRKRHADVAALWVMEDGSTRRFDGAARFSP